MIRDYIAVGLSEKEGLGSKVKKRGHPKITTIMVQTNMKPTV